MKLSVTTDVWTSILPLASDEGLQRVVAEIAHEAQARRVRASYDTGSILDEEACLLRALVVEFGVRVVIEVGTFIGTSTLALAGPEVKAVYTCDVSNDCLESGGAVKTFPKQSSTDMLRVLCRLGVRADLCFFDGVLSDTDAVLLREVTHAGTVYAFHDYNYGPKIRKHGLETVPRKGIGNVRLLQPLLPHHQLIEPRPDTTLALLVPESRR